MNLEPPERFVAAVTEDRADIVGLSALLTTTMLQMRSTVRALEGRLTREDADRLSHSASLKVHPLVFLAEMQLPDAANPGEFMDMVRGFIRTDLVPVLQAALGGGTH